MFNDYDDDTCSDCGIRLDVISPPGPQHLKTCHIKIKEDKEAKKQDLANKAFIKKNRGKHPCGCAVDDTGLSDICLSKNCVFTSVSRV